MKQNSDSPKTKKGKLLCPSISISRGSLTILISQRLCLLLPILFIIIILPQKNPNRHSIRRMSPSTPLFSLISTTLIDFFNAYFRMQIISLIIRRHEAKLFHRHNQRNAKLEQSQSLIDAVSRSVFHRSSAAFGGIKKIFETDEPAVENEKVGLFPIIFVAVQSED